MIRPRHILKSSYYLIIPIWETDSLSTFNIRNTESGDSEPYVSVFVLFLKPFLYSFLSIFMATFMICLYVFLLQKSNLIWACLRHSRLGTTSFATLCVGSLPLFLAGSAHVLTMIPFDHSGATAC